MEHGQNNHMQANGIRKVGAGHINQ